MAHDPADVSSPKSGVRADQLEWAKTPQALLELIGRNAPKHLGEKGKTWDGLNEVFKQGTAPMKEAGVGVKDRKWVILL